MRLEASLLVAGLVALLLAPGAGAHVEAVETDSSSGDTLPDPLCVPVCEVTTTTFGNAPVVTVVESGTNVTWTLTEGRYHTATSDVPSEDKEQLIVDADSTFRDSCLAVNIFDFQPGYAHLRIEDGTLQVLQPQDQEPAWTDCPEAVELPDGSFFLSYHCNNHPRFQQAGIVVVPETSVPETV